MLLKSKIKPLLSALVIANLLTACTGMAVPVKKQAELVQGPPITDIFTHFDLALMCLNGQFRKDIAFSVGAILDQTGKDAVTNGGSGKFVTQGAGDMVQSALFQAGVTVLNRRDPRIIESEAKLGIRNPKLIKPTDYFITGSINSLDFIPGGGFDIQVSGVGPAYSQTRIIVGLDVSLTDAKTSQVVANVSLQKQIIAQDYALNSGRFVGRTLLNVQIGAGEREATNFALRQMLNLATFELLSQVIPPSSFSECRAKIPAEFGDLKLSKSSISLRKYEKEIAKKKVENKQSELPNSSLAALKHEANVGTITEVTPTDSISHSKSSISDATSEDNLNNKTPELIKNSDTNSDDEAKRKKDTVIKYSLIPSKNTKLDNNLPLKSEKKPADINQVETLKNSQPVTANKSLIQSANESREKPTETKKAPLQTAKDINPASAEKEKQSKMTAKKSGQKDASEPVVKIVAQEAVNTASAQSQQAKQENSENLPLVLLDKITGDFKFLNNVEELNSLSNVSESKEREASIKPTETKLETSDSSRTTVKAANKKEKIKKSEISNQAPLETAKNEETDTLDKKSDVTADSSHQSSNTLTQENSQMSEGFWDEESTPDPSKDVRNNVVLR
jgi:curli biogenesis system outer membrane secretion channel CsgG